MVVPGNFPIGCFPIYLTGFKTNDSTAYDENKCLKDLNELSKFHNDHLQQEIRELNKEVTNAVITYGDYYKSFEWLFKNAAYLGKLYTPYVMVSAFSLRGLNFEN